jgi:hypothetical protein
MTARGKAHDEATAGLCQVLGAQLPPEVAALGVVELIQLRRAIEGARARHSQALRLAMDQALLPGAVAAPRPGYADRPPVSGAGASTATAAEIVKLRRLLDVDEGALEFLATVQAMEIRKLRLLATAALFDADREMLSRVANASRLLPAGLVAAITRRAFGPLLAARITGFMDPKRAADVGRHMDPPFLADICIQLDPRKAKEIIPRMDVDTVVAVTEELLERADYVTLGRFVGSMPGDVLDSVLEVTEDDELLRVCAVAESSTGVDEIFGALSADRMADVRRIARRKDMREEALVLGDRLQVR